MSSAFNAQSKNMGDLLGSSQREQLVVPQFQRGYSWEKRHVESFLNDIARHMGDNATRDTPGKYFLGPIVLLPCPESQSVEVLDGQQRLATATIVLCAIRDVARTLEIRPGIELGMAIHHQFIVKEEMDVAGENVRYALVLGEMDRDYFINNVQANDPGDEKARTKSQRNIKTAKKTVRKFIEAAVANKSPADAVLYLRELRNVLRSDLVMASIPVESEEDAFHIFETLNDRGLRLSVPDLLLNYLMRVATPKSRRATIRDMWDEMLEKMGTRDINRFLRHMWVSRYGDIKKQGLFSELKSHIEATKVNSLEFARRCSDECDVYVQLLDASESLGKAAPTVKTLVRTLNVQAALPLLLSSRLCLDNSSFEKVARWVTAFSVRYSVIARLDASSMENVLFELARDVRERMVAGKDAPPNDKIVGKCLSHIKATLKANAPTDEHLAEVVKDYEVKPEHANYIMMRLADRMQSGTKEIVINWTVASLEHIFPRGAKASDWDNIEELKPHLWHIGNLTILGEKINGATANKAYVVKRKHYERKTDVAMSKRIANDYEKWDEDSIVDRAAKLAPIVAEIWNMDNPSRV